MKVQIAAPLKAAARFAIKAGGVSHGPDRLASKSSQPQRRLMLCLGSVNYMIERIAMFLLVRKLIEGA